MCIYELLQKYILYMYSFNLCVFLWWFYVLDSHFMLPLCDLWNVCIWWNMYIVFSRTVFIIYTFLTCPILTYYMSIYIYAVCNICLFSLDIVVLTVQSLRSYSEGVSVGSICISSRPYHLV